MVEIERKFLVLNNSYKNEAHTSYIIIQGFLNSDKNRVVRIRITDQKAFITVKGQSSLDGTTRFEWEKPIEIKDAKQLLELCEKTIIEKTRYLISVNNHTFEVDEFLGENKGLVIAEIELKTADETFIKPTWLGQEITGITKYYNSNISKNPFKFWT